MWTATKSRPAAWGRGARRVLPQRAPAARPGKRRRVHRRLTRHRRRGWRGRGRAHGWSRGRGWRVDPWRWRLGQLAPFFGVTGQSRSDLQPSPDLSWPIRTSGKGLRISPSGDISVTRLSQASPIHGGADGRKDARHDPALVRKNTGLSSGPCPGGGRLGGHRRAGFPRATPADRQVRAVPGPVH